MIINEILSHQLKSQEELDAILARCCELVLNGQTTDPDHWGMVAACVVLPTGEEVYGVNHVDSEGNRIHAERAALNACEFTDGRSMIVTTLSPCNRPMADRVGESCTDLISHYDIGLENIYCGYKDPTQAEDGIEETNNPKLRELCKRLADTFLEDLTESTEEKFADGVLRFTNHVNARANQRGIPMSKIIQAVKRLEMLRGNDLKKLPPTGFLVRGDGFDLAIVKSQDINTKKIEYVITTVHKRLRPGAGQRILYLENQNTP